ncbi:MAG: restriction endonuclease subunit S [Candidatus Bipolaricaulis sp.]|nr:restriction endonuclease subunit S [Candidatus Bipolaricaulis sp.]
MSSQQRPRSQAEWIVPGTDVPADGWALSRLGKVLSQANRRVQVQSTERYDRLGVRWYAAGPFLKDVAAGSEIKGKYLQSVRSGDFIYNRLFAWKGSFGVVSGEHDGCYVSDEFPVFEVDCDVADARFLWRWFSQPSVWNAIESWSSGSTRTSRLRFRESDLLNMVVPLPPLPEQRAIARVLRTVQEAIAATEWVIEAAKELKRSMMEYLFTYGPVPVDQADRVALKETEIGAIPTRWALEPFGDAVEIAKGQINPTEAPYSSMLNVGPENVVSETGELLPLTTASQLGLTSGKYHFTDRDVLYSKIRPYLAKAALPEFEGICSADMYPVRPISERLSREILFHYLLSRRFTRQAISFQNRTGIPKINRAQLGSVLVPLPPCDEQPKIAGALAAAASYATHAARRQACLEDVFGALLHNLMTGKVRVTPAEVDMEGA